MSEAGQILDQDTGTDAAAVLDANPTVPTEGQVPAKESIDDPRVSSKLEILIRREAQAMAREQVAKQREKDLEEKLKRVQDFEGVKSNPKAALEMLGLNYDELTKSMLQDGQVPPEVEIRKLKEELEAFKTQTKQEKQSDEEKKSLEEKRLQEETETRAITNFKSEITQYLSDNKSRYELIEFEGQNELVYDVIDEHYKRTIDPKTGVGKVMDISEAADKVELHLENREQDRKKLSKVQALWNTVPKAVQEKLMKQELQGSPKPARTLTNTLSSMPTRPRTTPMTDEERIKKAIAYAKQLRP